MSRFKREILSHLMKMLDDKIILTKKSIDDLVESRNNETKSSAGDKHETSRAMAQNELDYSQAQLNHLFRQQEELSAIDIEGNYKNVVPGSLVTTNNGIYFVSIGIGKIRINNETIYAISLASPIGKQLHQKIIRDHVVFQEREIIIENII